MMLTQVVLTIVSARIHSHTPLLWPFSANNCLLKTIAHSGNIVVQYRIHFSSGPNCPRDTQQQVPQNITWNITRKFPSALDSSKYPRHQELRTYYYYIIILHSQCSGVFPTSPDSTHGSMQPVSWRIRSVVFRIPTMCGATPDYRYNYINCLIIGNPNSLHNDCCHDNQQRLGKRN